MYIHKVHVSSTIPYFFVVWNVYQVHEQCELFRHLLGHEFRIDQYYLTNRIMKHCVIII